MNVRPVSVPRCTNSMQGHHHGQPSPASPESSLPLPQRPPHPNRPTSPRQAPFTHNPVTLSTLATHPSLPPDHSHTHTHTQQCRSRDEGEVGGEGQG